MDKNRRELFSLLTKLIAIEEHQFGCITISSLRNEGWINGETVFEKCLKDLLVDSNSILMHGYHPNWHEEIMDAFLPRWVEGLNSNVYKDGRYYYLKNDLDVIDNLYEYWLSPRFYYEPEGRRTRTSIMPARPILEIPPEIIDTDNLIQVAEVFGGVSNPWAGGYESTGRWIKKRYSNSELLYLPYRNMASLRFFGGENAVSNLVDSVFRSGLYDEIEEHCPGFWDEEFFIEEDETVAQAAKRLLPET